MEYCKLVERGTSELTASDTGVMRDLKVLLTGKNENMNKLYNMFENSGITPLYCDADPVDIQLTCLNEIPFAIVSEENSYNYNYSELIGKMLKNYKEPPYFYLLGEPFAKPRWDFPKSKFVVRVDNKYRHRDIVDKVKLGAVDICKRDYLSNCDISEHVSDLVHTALSELCFTANYAGTSYLKFMFESFCLDRLKASDSLCKVIYPYAAKEFNVTPSSVERSIRTVIRKCWAISDSKVHSDYFGVGFTSKTDVPTNREFIMILGNTLSREAQKYRSQQLSHRLDDGA